MAPLVGGRRTGLLRLRTRNIPGTRVFRWAFCNTRDLAVACAGQRDQEGTQGAGGSPSPSPSPQRVGTGPERHNSLCHNQSDPHRMIHGTHPEERQNYCVFIPKCPHNCADPSRTVVQAAHRLLVGTDQLPDILQKLFAKSSHKLVSHQMLHINRSKTGTRDWTTDIRIVTCSQPQFAHTVATVGDKTLLPPLHSERALIQGALLAPPTCCGDAPWVTWTCPT